MRFEEILREMSPAVAASIFAKHGVQTSGLDKEAMKLTYRALAKRLHPDLGGSDAEMQELNAAYDTLKDGGVEVRRFRPNADGEYGFKQQDTKSHNWDTTATNTESVPTWAWAGYSGGVAPSSRIVIDDYRDLNFIKKRMWELSNRSRQQWTVWNYDGAFFRGSFTVFGSSEIFADMAEAMLQWDSDFRSRAIFVQKQNDPKKLYLVWLDNRNISPPIPIDNESFNSNPSNDQRLVRKLPAILNALKMMRRQA